MMSAPEARTASGFIALTVAAVPTGMKAGVRTSPRAVLRRPVLALPSAAEREKENGGIAGGAYAALLAGAIQRDWSDSDSTFVSI